jgi:hypothetical protein
MNKEKKIKTGLAIAVAGAMVTACTGTPEVNKGDCLWYNGRVAVENGGIVRTVHLDEEQRINHTRCVDGKSESISLNPSDTIDGIVEFNSGLISRISNISGSGERVWEIEQSSEQ